MAYIGKTPVIGNFVKLDSITVVNGQAAYTMQNGGVNFTSYDNVNQFLVSLNGVLQAPTDSFTVSGSTLTFASNLSTGDVIDFVLVLGNSLDIGTPSDNTVTTAKLADDAVTTAKITDANVTLAKLSATGTKDATTFLRGDNTFATVSGSPITTADNWRLTTAITSDASPVTGWERVDTAGQATIGSALTESSGYFTFPETGKYFFMCVARYQQGSASDNLIQFDMYYNSTRLVQIQQEVSMSTNGGGFAHGANCTFIDVTDTSHQMYFNLVNNSSSGTLGGSTESNITHFIVMRIGDT